MNGTLSKASVIMQAHNQAKFNFNEPSLGKGLTMSLKGLRGWYPTKYISKLLRLLNDAFILSISTPPFHSQ